MKQFTKIIGINLGILFVLLLIGEGVARYLISYNPSYYTSVNATNAVIEYPYGIIRRNSLGHPDDEFDLADSRPRVAYVGDSVTMGVGAGHGYRFSDILEGRFPQYQHMTLASIGDGFNSTQFMDQRVAKAIELGVNQFIYFYSLNDTLPTASEGAEFSPGEQKFSFGSAIRFIKGQTEFLRDKSYLFNWIRFKARNILSRFGIGYQGEPSYEFFPDKYTDVLDQVVSRINYLALKLKENGIAFTLVLIPAEMQISDDAAAAYSSHGVKWGDGFLAGKTQEVIKSRIDSSIRVLDARWAFAASSEDRKKIKTGQYYVYDKGDALDWQHPNREGHRLIADFLEREAIFRQLR